MTKLVLILGDQLSPGLASLRAADPAEDMVLMAEVAAEAGYVKHHKKKLAFVFAAMRHFAAELEASGWRLLYRRLDEDAPAPDLFGAVETACSAEEIDQVLIVAPGEWRLKQEMEGWADRLGRPVRLIEDDRYLASHADFERSAEGRKQLRMEYFYREMRRRTRLLMDGDQPEGGKWNYDAENRKPASGDLFMPRPPRFSPDAVTREVIAMVETRFDDHFGTLEPFEFAVTRTHAETARDAFLAERLPLYGDYQDAMLEGERFLYHAVIGLYLNIGLLEPLDLCRRAEAEYRAGRAPLNAVEGFIRQIIGWREFIRGIYWREGPDYVRRNALNATRDLPDFYWTARTDMACLKAVIGQTRDEAYAHHIQRLMVTGNFALLAGIDPHQVHEWYLAVYADAYEWVEAPNTVGMALFADGGVVGSKPYAASGAYIYRMSDYCSGCRYSVKQKTGPQSCPFNSLYWDFLVRNRETLGNNPRLGPVFRTWDRMKPEKQDEYRSTASAFLDTL